MLMGLSGALYAGYVGTTSPTEFLPIMTFQIWAMLIVGGSGNNRGALLGALIVWGLWSGSGVLISKTVPVAYQTQGAAVQSILIGLLLVVMLVRKPRGLIGEEPVVSRHVV
jgi:branched-chain amino acid transport system permease protein